MRLRQKNLIILENKLIAILFNLTTIQGQLKNTNELYALSDRVKAIYSVHAVKLLGLRILQTQIFLASLEALKTSLPDTSEYSGFIQTINSLISIYQSALNTVYIPEANAFFTTLDPSIQVLEQDLANITTKINEQQKDYNNNDSLEKKEKMSHQIINALTILINQTLSSISSNTLNEQTRLYLEFKSLILIDELYQQYMLYKNAIVQEISAIKALQVSEASQTDAAKKEKLHKEILEQIKALEKGIKKNLALSIFPETINFALTVPQKEALVSRMNQLQNNAVLALNADQIADVLARQSQVESISQVIVNEVNGILNAAQFSTNIARIFSCQIEFFVGLSEFYLQEGLALNELRVVEENKDYNYILEKQQLDERIRSLQSAQLSELQQTNLALKAQLNEQILKAISDLLKALDIRIANTNLLAFQISYYKSKRLEIQEMQASELARKGQL